MKKLMFFILIPFLFTTSCCMDVKEDSVQEEHEYKIHSNEEQSRDSIEIDEEVNNEQPNHQQSQADKFDILSFE